MASDMPRKAVAHSTKYDYIQKRVRKDKRILPGKLNPAIRSEGPTVRFKCTTVEGLGAKKRSKGKGTNDQEMLENATDASGRLKFETGPGARTPCLVGVVGR